MVKPPDKNISRDVLPAGQRIDLFRLPDGFRGANALKVQLWWMVHSAFFTKSPQFAYKFRAQILRAFGAKVGKHVLIRPSARVTYPWKVAIGDYCWIGDDVELYSLGDITLGAHTVISQRSYVCAADHDLETVDFAIRSRPIRIGEGCWIAADCFIGPGVNVGDGAVIGARSSVFRDMPAGTVCAGTPCKPVRPRHIT